MTIAMMKHSKIILSFVVWNGWHDLIPTDKKEIPIQNGHRHWIIESLNWIALYHKYIVSAVWNIPLHRLILLWEHPFDVWTDDSSDFVLNYFWRPNTIRMIKLNETYRNIIVEIEKLEIWMEMWNVWHIFYWQ